MATITVPLVGAWNSTGTASLETDQTSAFSFSNAADMMFAAEISASSFVGNFDVSGSHNDKENFSVRNMNTAGLKSALAAAMLLAKSKANSPYVNGNDSKPALQNSLLEEYLLNVAQNDLDADLDTDGIAASLSAAQMENVELSNIAGDVDTAAATLVAALSAQDCNVIALQFNNARWMAGAGDSEQSRTIPFLPNDKVIIRFIVSQSYTVVSDPKNKLPANATQTKPVDGAEGSNTVSAPSLVDPASDATTPYSSAAGSTTLYTVNPKSVDFELTLV